MSIAPSPVAKQQSYDASRLIAAIEQRFGHAVTHAKHEGSRSDFEFTVSEPEVLPTLAQFLFWELWRRARNGPCGMFF